MSPSSNPAWHFHDPTSTSSHTITSSSLCTISIASGAKTDWWTTATGSEPESAAHRTSGPVVYRSLTLDRSTNWKLAGSVTQSGSERFQQTTLFVRRTGTGSNVDDQHGQLWLKAGIENEGGRKYVGVVATNPYSDWNVSPLPASCSDTVHIEIEKTGPDVHVYYTVQGERLLLREKKGFALPSGESEEWWLGVMVCGPLSEATQGKVENWSFEELPATTH